MALQQVQSSELKHTPHKAQDFRGWPKTCLRKVQFNELKHKLHKAQNLQR